jgi:hypothetical protein
MTDFTGIVVLIIIFRIVWAIWALKNKEKVRSPEYSIVSILILLFLGLMMLSTNNDPNSQKLAYVVIGVAIVWGGWLYIRESGFFTKGKKDKRKSKGSE